MLGCVSKEIVMSSVHVWWLILGSFVVTYFWRGIGVLMSTRVNVEDNIFRWVSCIAYAMLAALVSRMIFLPAGPLEQTHIYERLLACGLALLVYFVFRRNLILSLMAGVGTIILLGRP